MYIERLHLLHFKNYEELSEAFIPGVNCITGPNGTGKTNLLDAIHYLCLTKSFLNSIDSQNITHGASFLVAEGKFFRKGCEEDIYLGLKRGQKKAFKRNKKDYEKLSAHIGLFPVVVISPQDIYLVTGGSEDRRKFIDSLISQYDPGYLDLLIHYNRILLQRNSLLKQFFENRRFEADILEVLSEQLASYGQPIHDKRAAFLESFIPVFEHYYAEISQQLEKPGLTYVSKITADKNLLALLQDCREKDRLALYTTEGPHKEDLEFTLDGHPLKKFGSQGQQKSYLVALKLAEHHFLGEKAGIAPILLLDDIFDKMDNGRVEQLLATISAEGFGQVFITDTGKEHIRPIFDQLGITVNFIDIGHKKIERSNLEGGDRPADEIHESGGSFDRGENPGDLG